MLHIVTDINIVISVYPSILF